MVDHRAFGRYVALGSRPLQFFVLLVATLTGPVFVPLEVQISAHLRRSERNDVAVVEDMPVLIDRLAVEKRSASTIQIDKPILKITLVALSSDLGVRARSFPRP